MFVPKKILVIATRQIGDVLITTPLIRRAKQIWPNSAIDVLGYKNTLGILEGNADINQVIESSEYPDWTEYKHLLGKIFRKYDFAIVSQPSDRAYLYGLLAAPKRVGIVPEKTLHSWWKKLFSSHTVTLNYLQQHVVAERFRLLDLYDPIAHRIPEVVPPVTDRLPESIENVLPKSFVVVHATPMRRFKRWTATGWSDVIRSLLNNDLQIVLTGSPSRQDNEINNQILDYLTANERHMVINLTGKMSLAETAVVLSRAAGYIGIDTSITHLAAACGTPTVAIYGATPPTNYGPWPKGFSGDQPWRLAGPEPANSPRIQTQHNVRIIQGIGSCVPCRKSGCLNNFESHSDCLDQLNSSAVMQAVTGHLKLQPVLNSQPQRQQVAID